ncbi:hypothetical protein JRO89_XS03G0150200 [Xanthoceras sorbifolium]|uniref:Uncharacterized protein n=1 Tax=Xanthoceras sorbifolium TaxID=99658 RepID=A0ABQ8I9Y2_9ROSI|nr:hypothetical protein JRO89_XS03G0150200 [Xanthoceras sorbifolium]
MYTYTFTWGYTANKWGATSLEQQKIPKNAENSSEDELEVDRVSFPVAGVRFLPPVVDVPVAGVRLLVRHDDEVEPAAEPYQTVGFHGRRAAVDDRDGSGVDRFGFDALLLLRVLRLYTLMAMKMMKIIYLSSSVNFVWCN